MTPKQQYYKNLADTMIPNLEKRGFEASYVPDRQAALEAIMPYFVKGNIVSCGGSITLNEIGFSSAVKDAECTFLDRAAAKTQEEKDALYSKVAVCEYQCDHNRRTSGEYRRNRQSRCLPHPWS